MGGSRESSNKERNVLGSHRRMERSLWENKSWELKNRQKINKRISKTKRNYN
jgi:hypothetical protein